MILQKMKSDAENYLGEKVTEAVITVRLISTMRSVRLPKMQVRSWSLDVKRNIINEPGSSGIWSGQRTGTEDHGIRLRWWYI